MVSLRDVVHIEDVRERVLQFYEWVHVLLSQTCRVHLGLLPVGLSEYMTQPPMGAQQLSRYIAYSP